MQGVGSGYLFAQCNLAAVLPVPGSPGAQSAGNGRRETKKVCEFVSVSQNKNEKRKKKIAKKGTDHAKHIEQGEKGRKKKGRDSMPVARLQMICICCDSSQGSLDIHGPLSSAYSSKSIAQMVEEWKWRGDPDNHRRRPRDPCGASPQP